MSRGVARRPELAAVAAIVAVVALGTLGGGTRVAHADSPPGAWDAVRDPEARLRYALHIQVTRRIMALGSFDRELAPDSQRHHALDELRDELQQAGAEQSPDVRLRLDLGRVCVMLEDYAAAARILEAALDLAPRHPQAEEALWQLAISYAHTDVARELATYDRYLKLAVRPEARSIAYSNRAEAEMRQGNLDDAIADARYAVALATQVDTAVLAGFDLAVALDRYGDAAGSAQAVKVAVSAARSSPKGLHMLFTDGAGVFYVPDYDKYWYRATAFAELAREETDVAEALRLWQVAELSWELFVTAADPHDRWLPLARRHAAEARKNSLRSALAAGSRDVRARALPATK